MPPRDYFEITKGYHDARKIPGRTLGGFSQRGREIRELERVTRWRTKDIASVGFTGAYQRMASGESSVDSLLAGRSANEFLLWLVV